MNIEFVITLQPKKGFSAIATARGKKVREEGLGFWAPSVYMRGQFGIPNLASSQNCCTTASTSTLSHSHSIVQIVKDVVTLLWSKWLSTLQRDLHGRSLFECNFTNLCTSTREKTRFKNIAVCGCKLSSSRPWQLHLKQALAVTFFTQRFSSNCMFAIYSSRTSQSHLHSYPPFRMYVHLIQHAQQGVAALGLQNRWFQLTTLALQSSVLWSDSTSSSCWKS